MATRARVPSPFAPRPALYQRYSVQEERERTNFHYENPIEFMTTITGAPWHVYSCSRWEEGVSQGQSQEAKFREVAAAVGMAPGQRFLDVGCGWGGPLTYYCLHYDLTGVGLTLSPSQAAFARARIADHGVNARVVESHWKEYQARDGFDIVHSDEVVVHFSDLGGYYRRMARLLRPGGRIITRELHYTHHAYAEQMSRGMQHINELFGATGNYRTLQEELALIHDAGLELVSLSQIPTHHYARTIDAWLSNMHRHRARLMDLVGRDYYRAFRAYLRLGRRTVAGTRLTLDMIICKRLGDR